MVSSATYGGTNDYIGLALPMDINDVFHIRDAAYFQQRVSPPSEERKRFLFGDGDGEWMGGGHLPPTPPPRFLVIPPCVCV